MKIILLVSILFSILGVPQSNIISAQEPAPIGRPVHIMSLGFPEASKSLEEVCSLIRNEAKGETDLVILPETWTGHNVPPEPLDGFTISAMSSLAKQCNTYIVCPIDRMEKGKRLNTAVLIDRNGLVVGCYDKVFPYWSEYELAPRVTPGEAVPVFETDFGRIGIAICFDVNFPEIWQSLADQDAELVVWPSAYSAGMSLQAHAINHHYYIVTATNVKDCLVYDITGENILAESQPEINISRITLDLDRRIYHENFNSEPIKKLLQDHPDDVVQEKWLTREQWIILKSKRPGVLVKSLGQQYGLEELRDYIRRSRSGIDKIRGWSFQERLMKSVKD